MALASHCCGHKVYVQLRLLLAERAGCSWSCSKGCSINTANLKFLLCTSQTLFYPDLHGIYPDTLLLKCAHSGTEVPFMDISIRPSGRGSRLTTVLYDKRRHEPLSSLFIIKYPHMSSNISETAKFNIIN